MNRIANLVTRTRPAAVYTLVVAVGAGAFLWPFFLSTSAIPDRAHAADAPLWAAMVGAIVVAVVLLEVRRGTITSSTIAVLGVLGAIAGLLRLLDLPGGGSGIFFLLVLAGAAFGPRFGLLLGLLSMAVSALLTGGMGPWLPFQMLALGWMGAGAGFVGRVTARLPGRRGPALEVAILAAYGWAWGFLYGAILNLWFWPFVRDGGPISYAADLSFAETLHRYWSFYVFTSLAWDAAGALANALLIALTGRAIIRSFRRIAARLEPAVVFDAGLPEARPGFADEPVPA